jgi:UDP-N-acetylmuramoyl-tripeptide--D-alanyl-D-alanine ligase
MVRRVWHDSRVIEPGDLYVAIVGERLDGHEFVAEAFARGAVAAIVDEAHAATLAELGRPLVVVDDTVAALARLAAYWRGLFDPIVVGITGSIGKSSTKEVVAAILSQRYRTVWSRASFNNEIGLPLTLLGIDPDTEAVVLEMGGAYAFGEITRLCEIARPKIGIVTNVSHSHLARMGSLEAIAQTKTELPAALPLDGVAVLNGDDERVRAMAAATRARTVFYGFGEDCAVRALDVRSHGLEGISFRLVLDGEVNHLHLPLLGRHSAHTALAGIATGWALGMGLDEILSGFDDPAIQLRLYTLPGVNGSLVIDDSYNANPTSSVAALNLLEELGERRIAVIGDMLELGSFAEEGHRIVGRRAAAVVDHLFVFGEMGRVLADEARSNGLSAEAVHLFEDKRALGATLRDLLRPGDVVLVKGSRGMQMEQVVAEIRQQKASE